MTAEDFVDVKLTAAGEALASGPALPEFSQSEKIAGERGAACLRIAGGNYEYCFEPGKTMRLPAAEFRTRLEATIIAGQAMFEIVPPAKPGKTRQTDAASERS